ncbi:MAG: bifunctional 4-hydroxy-3-methylbut-2-enyl diphosphate reductase/30S ribosomal protein S1 [Firmicutes bacterium]|nr:bifunctional 4-hydroxy-3-methylbut-2-enyl diphosphate reductase/30S ribosomal protein S1 [Bacillota bacterium]
MEIIRAEHSGFCFGVKRAIAAAEQEITKRAACGGTYAVYTVGPLIHNDFVTGDLAKRGVKIAQGPADARQGDVLIVRSHGEPKRFYDSLAGSGVVLTDATCPFVSRIHELVHQAYLEGKQILIVGDPRHPEVTATNGWCDDQALIVGSAGDVEEKRGELTRPADGRERGWFLVCQTTIRQETLDEVVAALAALGIFPEIENTICSATRLRQEACAELASRVDAMVVLGGKMSSNTRKLVEIAGKHCAKVFFAENIEDLPLKALRKYNTIGLAAGASTPERIIMEVIANMSETALNETNLNEETMESYMEEIDASLRLPRNGDVVEGKVLQVSDKEVIVNLGCKKDGILPVDEVTLEEGQKLTDAFHAGDDIKAKVVKVDGDDGSIRLSKKKLEVGQHWDEICEAHENKSVINVKVLRAVNGGVIAAYKEVTGFIPMSQLSDKYVESENVGEFIGQSFDVRVIRVDPKRNRAVFSHKVVLNDEKQKLIENVWNNLKVGDVVDGQVMRFTDYGAFVDIGGIDGLLHISEISWGKLKHPQEVLSIGDKIRVKILSMNQEKGKISLGLKQITPEPWSVINEKYEIGSVVTGKVVQIKEYGAFVELEPGLDGLVHISEVAHKRVADIADELTLGQVVKTKILDIDTERKRISLSIKATIDPNEEAQKAEEAAVAKAEEEVAEDAELEQSVEQAAEEVAAEVAEEAAPVTE